MLLANKQADKMWQKHNLLQHEKGLQNHSLDFGTQTNQIQSHYPQMKKTWKGGQLSENSK